MSNLKVTVGNITVEGESQRDVFEQVAKHQEVFGISQCGDEKCGSTDLRYVVRVNDGNTFYEMRCNKCHAKLAFGAHKKETTLFPKEWTRWNPQTKVEEKI